MAATERFQESVDKNQDTSSYDADYDKIKAEFESLNPAKINTACTAWSRVARHIGQLANELHDRAAKPLADAWESKTSPEAQQQLQLAQATASALADQAMQMARATDFAYQYAQWYKDHMPGTGAYHSIGGMFKDGADDQAAVDHLVRFLSRYNEVIAYCVPPSVQAELAQNRYAHENEFTPTPGPGPGPGSVHPTGPGPGPGLPTSPIGPGPHHPGLPSGPGPGPGGIPHGPGPGGIPHGPGPGGTPIGPGTGIGSTPSFGDLDTGSSLAGVGGSGAGGLDGGFGGGLAGGVGGSAGAGLGGGAGAGLAGGGAGLAGGGAGLAGAGGVAPGGGAAGGAGRGMMMPMHGSGNNGDEERERSTWLTEDEDVWGTSEASPGLIEG